MKLSRESTPKKMPEAHYIFIEKTGPFEDTAKPAWKDVLRFLPQIEKQSPLIGMMGMFKPKEEIYRAGFAVKNPPQAIEGLRYEKFRGGMFAKWTLTGSYEQIPEACKKIFKQVNDEKMLVRHGEFCVENYLNSPMETPEEKLLTEILIPIET